MVLSSNSDSHSNAIDSATSSLRVAARALEEHREKEIIFVGFEAGSHSTIQRTAVAVARAIAAEGLCEEECTGVRYGDLAELLDYVALMLEE